MSPLSNKDLEDQTFYAIDEKWMDIWRSFHSSRHFPALSERPGPLMNSSLRCKHGFCLLSDELRMISDNHCPKEAVVLGPSGDGLPRPYLVTALQWNSLNEFYGTEVSAKSEENPEDEQENISPFSVRLRANAEGQLVLGPLSMYGVH